MHITSPQREHPEAVATTMEHAAGALDFWKAKLAGDLPVLELPADRPRSVARPSSRGDGRAGPAAAVHTAPVRICADAVAAQHRLAGDEDTTPFVVALAGFKVFLARMARQRDIIVGTARPYPAVLRTALDGMPTFREAIRRVAATVREAGEHGAVPLQRLLAELGIPQERLCQAAFRYGDPAAPFPANLAPDVSVHLRAGADELTGEIECAAELFDQSTVERFAAILAHLLEHAAAAPDQPVFGLPLLPSGERDRILHRLNPYHRPDLGYTTMAQPFEEQVRRTPELPAVTGAAASLTYAELNERANRLAWFLRDAGARPGAFVAVSMERGVDLMVALYAVAKSGAGYVPIDPELPDARIAFMLEDSAPVAALVDRATQSRLPSGPWLTVPVDGDGDRWAGQPARDLPPEPGNHLIHMIYTSGTTGRPKAVSYPVDGALADIFWMQAHYPYRPGDTAILKTSYGFDVSIWEIFWPLYCGARVALCPPGGQRDPVRLRDFIDQHQVTAMFMVPTMLQPFLAHTPPGGCASLRRVYVGGEPVPPRVRDGFHERFAADLVNCYGPTELGCVAETVLAVDPGAPVMVGRPPAHRRAYVLDDNLDPAPIGVPGELFVGGEAGIAQSYHRRPALTAARFLADPYGPPGGRMYRTGDLCRYREDGVLEHLGRIGRQVKIRGMRIELAEIEAIFAEHDDVGQCVVAVVPDRDGEIAAFVLPAGGHTISMPALLSHAAALLPTHMRPATVTVVDHIPTFVHGKVDVGALLSRIDRPGGTDPQPVAPANDLERRLVQIYSEILGRDRVSVTDSFIDLGGHSLLILKLVEVCAAEFQVEMSIEDVVKALSARELAAALARSGAGGGDPT